MLFLKYNMGYTIILLMMLQYCHCEIVGDSLLVLSYSKDFHDRNFTYRTYDILTTLFGKERNASTHAGTSVVRIKRQMSSGKFTEAAMVSQLKMLRLFLTMFKNLWAKSYVGGSNPFHPNVPKPAVQLYKEKIDKFFFPDIGEETVKQK